MTSADGEKIMFGPFEVTSQVFLKTAHSFGLVNIKPLLPGHVLVVPLEPRARLADLSPAQLTDLFTTVQLVQRMLAARYFSSPGTTTTTSPSSSSSSPTPPSGSFNVAIQDGPEAGQTVPHLHVHVFPRARPGPGADPGPPGTQGDAVYERMTSEDGNVGGALWDRAVGAGPRGARGGRPRPGGAFPSVEDASRELRSEGEMAREAEEYREIIGRLQAGL